MRRLAGLFLLALTSCPSNRQAPTPGPSSVPTRSPVRYADVTTQSGIAFQHENGARGRKRLPETMGSGVAILDADGDGLSDLFFVNQRTWSDDTPTAAPATTRLYRNLGKLQFEDASERMDAAHSVVGMGAYSADLEGDGDADLLVTALGDPLLLLNEGARFREAARERGLRMPHWTDGSGKSHPSWSTAAVFLDYDLDGQLDVYIATYARWSADTDIFATLDGKTKAYTTPELYPGDCGRLFRGRGDGRFEDVTDASGAAVPNAKSLGAVACDLESDGWPDLVIANDTQPNFLLHNQKGHFQEIGVAAGIAYDGHGRARAGMGIDAARLDADGPQAIAIGNFAREPVSLFLQRGAARFEDRADELGVARATELPLTFGLQFCDVDLDGRLDLLLSNGHIEPTAGFAAPEVTYAQNPQLLLGLEHSRFVDVSASAGEPFRTPLVGRGLAAGDLDGDGDPEIVISQNGRAAVLLRCDRADGAPAAKCVRIRLEGKPGNRDAFGAVVRARIGGRTEERSVRSGGSYLSQSETTLTFGLGAAEEIERLEVRWPTGERTVAEHLKPSASIHRISP